MVTLKPQSRFRGALVGVLTGDALGAPYEGWAGARVEQDLEKRGGLMPFDYENPWYGKTETVKTFPKGRPTDDSDHTAVLAQSLIDHNGLNEKELYYSLRRVVAYQWSPLWEGKAIGAGKTTRTMLAPETYEESVKISAKGAYPSNGSLMRAAPMALYFAATRREGGIDPYAVLRMSSVTHRHPLSRECCVAYVAILTELLRGEYHSEVAIKRVRFLLRPWRQEVEEILDYPTLTPQDPGSWKEGWGSAVLTLRIALWVLTTTSSFREGMTQAISFGGDTDTYAAVAGGLLGAYYGEEAIPREWRDVLLGRTVMENLADEFSIIANEHLL